MDAETDSDRLFRLYDYFCASVIGVATAVLVEFAVPPSWPMLIGMFAGMFIGMIVLFVAISTLGLVAGSIELMAAGMFTAKIVGMVCGMWVTMAHPATGDLAFFGLAAALLMQGIFHLYDLKLHGEVRPSGKDGL